SGRRSAGSAAPPEPAGCPAGRPGARTAAAVDFQPRAGAGPTPGKLVNEHEVTVEAEVELPLPEAAVHGTLVRAVEATLAHSGAPPSGLTILLVDDERIAALNREFLGEDKPTDVLSFPAGEPMPGMEAYLGDIAIAIPVAMEQARSAGHDLLDELAL